MRTFLFFLIASLYTVVGYAQADSASKPRTPTKTQVLIPGVDSPISAPGTLMQSSPQPNAVPPDARDKRKTNPPADPRAFGVGIPIGKAKKDTLNQ